MEAWERIETIMEEQGLNKNSLSRRMGLQNNVTITKIVNDHRSPQTSTLEKLADAFPQYNREWILYGNEPKMAIDAQNVGNFAPSPTTLGNTSEKEKTLLETLNRLIEQNAKLIEVNDRNSKSIERLIDFLVSNGLKVGKQII